MRAVARGGNSADPANDHSDMTMLGPWVGTGCRAVLGAVLLIAGGLKLPDPASAERAVRAYQLLPEPLVAPIAFGLPVLEIALGLLLLLGVFVRSAAVGAAVLMAVFLAAVGSAWARGLTIDCGCFGGGGQVDPDDTAYLSEILRDLGLLALAAVLIRRPRSRLALTDRAAPPPDTDTDTDTVPGDTDAVRN